MVMPTGGSNFKSRGDHQKQLELEAARIAGLAPAEVDKDGNEINPHIPNYISSVPWYLNPEEKPSLQHQRKRKLSKSNQANPISKGGGKATFQADKYRKGACENCGAMTHGSKSCMERPRKLGAKWTNKHIAPDETVKLSDDHDYDAAIYARVVEKHEATDQARRKFLTEQQLMKLEGVSGDVDRVDESKQMDFAKVKKRVGSAGGGTTGTVRNLRIREDTAKYLVNLDLDSAYYDPKSRSMREDPVPDADPNDNCYLGDNHYRVSGQALELKQLSVYAWESSEKGAIDIQLQGAPSQAELLFKNFKVPKDKIESNIRNSVLEKYASQFHK